MLIGYYNGRKARLYEDGENFIIEFMNGSSITVSDATGFTSEYW